MKTWILFIIFAVAGGLIYWYMGDITALITSTSVTMPSLKTISNTWDTVTTNPAVRLATAGVSVATPLVFSALYNRAKQKQKAVADKQLAEASRQSLQSVSQVETEKLALQQQLSSMKDEVTVLHAQKLDAAKFTELLDAKQRELNRLHGDLSSAERLIRELKTVKHETYVP